MRIFRLVPIVALMLTALPLTVAAGTLNVRTWGADSGTCGDKDDPCLTIGQAIVNAAPKDKIVVGPGTYPEPLVIDKAGLKLESTAGARATIITTDGSGDDLVYIGVNDVKLGKKKKGFTVLGGMGRGVHIEGNGCECDSIRAIDNGSDGFVLNADRASFDNCEGRDNGSDGFDLSGDNVTVEDCVSTGNDDDGFALSGNNCTVEGSLATDNSVTGFNDSCDAGSEYKENAAWRNGIERPPGHGFRYGSDNVEVTKNVAGDNEGHGFLFEGNDAEAKSNVARGNALDGFFESSMGAVVSFEKNTAAENLGSGFMVKTADAGGIEFKKNNTYANSDCGLLNDTSGTLTTDGTWWGQDPPTTTAGATGADVCDNGNTTLTDPASKEGSIKVKGEL